jgi:hypothetical protein
MLWLFGEAQVEIISLPQLPRAVIELALLFNETKVRAG